MDYKEAYQILDAKADGEKLILYILDGNISSAVEYVKEVTKCDEVIAKAIVLDLGDGLITEEKNVLKGEQSQSNIPRCPTCGSIDLKRIRFIETYLDISCGTNVPTFRCGNCGYRW